MKRKKVRELKPLATISSVPFFFFPFFQMSSWEEEKVGEGKGKKWKKLSSSSQIDSLVSERLLVPSYRRCGGEYEVLPLFPPFFFSDFPGPAHRGERQRINSPAPPRLANPSSFPPPSLSVARRPRDAGMSGTIAGHLAE